MFCCLQELALKISRMLQTRVYAGPGVILTLCGFYYGAFHVESCLALCSRFSIVITSLGEERELAYVLLVHLFVYFARVDFVLLLFLFVSWIGCGL